MNSVVKVARMLSRQPAPPMRLRQAVVVDINTNRTVDLTLGGVEIDNVPCLTSGVPRVGSAVMVIICGRDMFVLGSVADATAFGYTPLIQSGHFTAVVSAATNVSTSITFPWAFPGIPDVVAVADRGATSAKPYIATIRQSNVTASAVGIRVSSFDGSSNSENIEVGWVAMQAGE